MEKQNPDLKKIISELDKQPRGALGDWILSDLFLDISKQMLSFSDIDRLTAFFVNKVAKIFHAGKVSLMLLDQAGKELSIRASCGLDSSASNARIKLGQMFGGWVAQQGNPLLVKDVETEFPDLQKGRLSRYKSKSFIIVPIGLKQAVIGILNLTDKKDKNAFFTEYDLKVLNLFCHCLALHIENIKLSESNAQMVTVDTLTGLFNHRYFQELLLEEIYHAERYRSPLSLLMLDIDNFSQYNQAYGYSAGDDALKQISGILKENMRRVDKVARYGPEEFMMILPNTRLKQTMVAAERIRERINSAVFTEDRTSSLEMARLTVSIGIAEHKIGIEKEELIRRVISALLKAKQAGKNRVCVFK